MTKYGVKIKNFSCGVLYEYNLGVREYLSYTNAMFVNNLLSYYLLENGMRVSKDGHTRDIICIDFDFGAKSYEETKKKIEQSMEIHYKENGGIEDERIEKLNYILDNVEANKDKYVKKSKQDIRKEFYKNGVDITYITKNKKGEITKQQTIHYKMLYRSTGKAKEGSCMFISQRLYKKAHDFIYMGLKLKKHNAPIVEASAYVSLVASSIIDRIKINPKNILILKDVDSFFNTKVVSIETNSQKECYARTIDDYKVKNTLFDGQALLDDSVFPSWGNGYVLLRHHMCKTAAFKSHIQQFFKDYFGDEYETAKVIDMFGNEHYAKDIQMITTDNAMKWLKFDVSYEYWCNRVNMTNNMFGVVKTAHKSKLGNVQRMSYQMINSLDIDIMPDVLRVSEDYINSIKRDDQEFLKYLEHNQNFANDYEVLVDLCKYNPEFIYSVYFRARKREIIRTYIRKFKTGKVIQGGDNLVMVGSPYAMLLHAVGEDVNKDDTFHQRTDSIECYTERFGSNIDLCGFRSPHNGKNNILALHNVSDERLRKYFEIGEQCVAVNCIHTDLQDRANGCDFDSDTIYCTDQEHIAQYAKVCYKQYPTIVNNIPKEQNKYDNCMEDYAIIDNGLATSQIAIGESSNLAQLALTYTYNYPDKKYIDYVCILSVLAQVSIDSAKRRYDIDINKEIQRIKKDMNIKENGYPLFWLNIRRGFNPNKINRNLKCPMNVLVDMKFKEYQSIYRALPMTHFFKQFPMKDNRRKSKKVEGWIQKYALELFCSQQNESHEYFLLRQDFDEMIEDIRNIYLSKEYVGLMSWLINRGFCITPATKGRNHITNSRLHKNKAMLLKVLYNVNRESLLQIFSKNLE